MNLHYLIPTPITGAQASSNIKIRQKRTPPLLHKLKQSVLNAFASLVNRPMNPHVFKGTSVKDEAI